VEHAHRSAVLARLLEGMWRGQPWREAVQAAGLTVSRATAYRLLRRRRIEGEIALHDRRHGHPYVLRAPVRHWLEAYYRAHPNAFRSPNPGNLGGAMRADGERQPD